MKLILLKTAIHPSSRKNIFNPHFKHHGNVEQKAINKYGRTAVWYSNYYNFPKLNSNPVIAIISLGGGY